MKFLLSLILVCFLASCDIFLSSDEQTKVITYTVTGETQQAATKADIAYFDYNSRQVVKLRNEALPWKITLQGKPSVYFFVSAKPTEGSYLQASWSNGKGSKAAMANDYPTSYTFASGNFCSSDKPECSTQNMLDLIDQIWESSEK